MCGIAGFCDFNKQSSPEILAQMTDTMIHRGPDSSGFKYQEDSAFEIGLGHRRLSILDLSELGSQPMSFEHLHIVLNGEIYNFKEIRKELEESGYSFASWSDTEVVLKAFHKWDVKAVDRFIGMFSFAIFDEKNRQIYLFRDRAGVKPLYYYFEKGLLLFGSELRSLIKHPLFKKRSIFRQYHNTSALAIFRLRSVFIIISINLNRHIIFSLISLSRNFPNIITGV
jgi:asparagine synthase (glutamine-hydrolysing)